MSSRAGVIHCALCCSVLLAVPHPAAAQERVPDYNVKPECQFTQSVIPSPESEKQCLREEQAARVKLEQNWASYPRRPGGVRRRKQHRRQSELRRSPHLPRRPGIFQHVTSDNNFGQE